MTLFVLLGRPTSLLFEALLLLIVRPDLESITFPEPSTIRVLDPDVLPLVAEELRELAALLLYSEDRPL